LHYVGTNFSIRYIFGGFTGLSSAAYVSSPEADCVDKQQLPWYGIRTRANHEQLTAMNLDSRGYQPYVPTYLARRNWSDRVKIIHAPLFPGYVFCRFNANHRQLIITAPGVVSVICFGEKPAPIPDSEIEAIQTILQSGLATEPCPFLREGQRVRVTRGSLKDIEGLLIKKKADWRLVVSVNMLQRSVSVEVDSDSVSPL